MKKSVPGALKVEQRRFRIMAGVHILWFAVLFLLGGWWGNLLLRQASQIAALESQLGIADQITHLNRARTERMVLWESSTLLALLLAGTWLVIWLYWRDAKRARAAQAFFASFTHELRTPLTSIRLQAESIIEALDPKNPHQTMLSRLLDDTTRLEGQVERALELARLEGGGGLLPSPVSLLGMTDRFIKNAGVAVDNQCADLNVHADPVAVQVILRNLLENTTKHSGQAQSQIKISSEAAGDRVRLYIRDNGVSTSPLPDAIGEIFQKGPHSQGAGVGLYLVRSLMRQMGGEAVFHRPGGFEVILDFREAGHDG